MISPATRTRCGIDSVELARIDRLLRESHAEDLGRIFSAEELRHAGEGAGRTAALAARFAAKEACLKLFPRETALGELAPGDFAVARDGYGAPSLVVTAKVQDLLDRYRLRGVALSLTHDGACASAMAVSEPVETAVPPIGKLLYHLLPIRRRVVLENLRRVFGERASEAEIVRLAQAFYAHLARSAAEALRFGPLRFGRRSAAIRVENENTPLRAVEAGKGVLILTGHFGNWEIAIPAMLASYPQYRGRFHFLRRPLYPEWLFRLAVRRFERAGVGVIPKRGGLGTILERLEEGKAVVFVLDQHAAARDGVRVAFFGEPASTFRSLAVLALATGAPVVPMTGWREADGTHVLRFEDPLPTVECEDPAEAIRRNTRAYNAALERMVLRHPEQWFWMHRRWRRADGDVSQLSKLRR